MIIKSRRQVFIVGCSTMGAFIAGNLSKKGDNVVIIDKDATAFQNLPSYYSGFQIEADGTDVDALKEAGVESADLFVVATDSDNVNVMVAQIAAKIFGIKKVIVRLESLIKGEIIAEPNIKIINPSALALEYFFEITEEEEVAK